MIHAAVTTSVGLLSIVPVGIETFFAQGEDASRACSQSYLLELKQGDCGFSLFEVGSQSYLLELKRQQRTERVLVVVLSIVPVGIETSLPQTLTN